MAVRVGARRRLPMNCGSIARPEGWGKPNIREVQPEQSRVMPRLTPKMSRIDWSQQRVQKAVVAKKKILRNLRESKSFCWRKVVSIVMLVMIRHQRMPAVRTARRGLVLQKALSVR